MSGRGTQAQLLMKLRKYQIADLKERQAIEVIADAKAGIVRPTHEQEKEMARDAMVDITLKKLGLHFQFQS